MISEISTDKGVSVVLQACKDSELSDIMEGVYRAIAGLGFTSAEIEEYLKV